MKARHAYSHHPQAPCPPINKGSAPSVHRIYSTAPRLTHLDEQGRASMVDVSEKLPSKRIATASGVIRIPRVAYQLVTSSFPEEDIINGATPDPEGHVDAISKVRRKGDALTIAQIAGIMGAKQTSNLIPLCHPLSLSKVDVKLYPEVTKQEPRTYHIRCSATVSCEGKTGVEMEALTAVSIGLLTVWDMLKAIAGKEMEIGQIAVTHKSGGRSGDFNRDI